NNLTGFAQYHGRRGIHDGATAERPQSTHQQRTSKRSDQPEQVVRTNGSLLHRVLQTDQRNLRPYDRDNAGQTAQQSTLHPDTAGHQPTWAAQCAQQTRLLFATIDTAGYRFDQYHTTSGQAKPENQEHDVAHLGHDRPDLINDPVQLNDQHGRVAAQQIIDKRFLFQWQIQAGDVGGGVIIEGSR